MKTIFWGGGGTSLLKTVVLLGQKSARNISDVDPGMEKENREAAERIYDNGGLLLSSH